MKRLPAILQVIDDASIGGGQQHLRLLATGLRRQSFRVEVACQGRGYLVDELTKKRIKVHDVNLGNALTLRGLFHVIRILRKGTFDIVHTHGGTAGLWGRLAGVFAGTSVRVHTYHGLHTLYKRSLVQRFVLKWIERWLVPATTHVICVSKGDLQAGVRSGLVKEGAASVIPNGIEVRRFSDRSGRGAIRKEFRVRPSDILILCLGRFHVQKGHTFLLKAVPQVLRDHPSARFLLVGDGPLENELRGEVNALGIGSHVIFAGARYDTPRLYAGSDIVVLPSLWEGYPLVVLEASAARKPIIATAVAGNAELIDDGHNGLLVGAEDPPALASAIGKLCRDRKLRSLLGRNAGKKATKEFDASLMVGKTAELYRGIVEQRLR